MIKFTSFPIVFVLTCCSIQSTLGDLFWKIEGDYPNNIVQKPVKDTTKFNRVYPVVVFPDNDPLEIKLNCIKERYEGTDEPQWIYGDLQLVGEVKDTKDKDTTTGNTDATWTSTIRISSNNAGIEVGLISSRFQYN